MSITIKELEKYNYTLYQVAYDVTIVDKINDSDMNIDNLSDFGYSFEEEDKIFDNAYTEYELRYKDYITVYETNYMEDMVNFIKKNYDKIKNETLTTPQ